MSHDAATLLSTFRTAGVLSALDVHFASAMGRLACTSDPLVLLGAAMASRAPAHGHVCAEIPRLRDTVRPEVQREELVSLPWPETEGWLEALRRSPLVGRSDGPPAPLVLDGERLYLDRYFRYQERLVAALLARVFAPPDEVDLDLLRGGLTRLFTDDRSVTGPNLQALATASAVLRGFSVVSGGPGTGKTTTVVKLLVLLLEQAHARAARGEGRFPVRIALLAPTGKAAARMTEAIRRNAEGLTAAPEILSAIPSEASTIHRALGTRPDNPTRFRHDRDNPLPFDVVVVDEASMVDLALMTKLIEAVPDHARLVLLGDRDQLASVEAGAVLGDICNVGGGKGGLSAPFARSLADLVGDLPAAMVSRSETAGIGDATTHLTHTYRFGDDSGIGLLARAINDGDADTTIALLCSGGRDDVALLRPASPFDPGDDLRNLVVEGYRDALRERDPAEALKKLEDFRLLCAHRRGPLGVSGMNQAAERWLVERGLLTVDADHYRGRPILVTQNDYQQSLFNGDTGLVLHDPDRGALRAFFPDSRGGGVRSITPGRLPPHETVFAMTVHKSQGSELTHVVVVLPSSPSPVLTRELLYTAVTRARRRVTVVGTEEVIRHAVRERVQRASGVREKLWGWGAGGARTALRAALVHR